MASSKTLNSTTYVTPRTWTTGELVTKSIMDTYVSAQETALASPASFYIKIDELSDYTTASTSFGTIGSTELSATITTSGRTIWVSFSGEIGNAGANRTYVDLLVDGAQWAGNDGFGAQATSSTDVLYSFMVPVTGLLAASHTFALTWKVSGGTATLYAGAGTASHDTHPFFSAFELA